MEVTLGVDVSRYNEGVDWKQLKAAGVEFAIVKVSQGTYGRDKLAQQHLEGAKAAGMVTGVYHWCDPTHYDGPQLENFAKSTENLEFNFAAADVEQYWADWQEYFDKKVTKFVSPKRISENGLSMAQGMQKVTGKRTLIYTRATFVLGFAWPMLNWLSGWDLWLAHYPYPKARVSMSWAELIARNLPTLKAPDLPDGCKHWKFWQFSGDRFVLPGAGGIAIDLNFFNGSVEQLKSWAGVAPGEDEQAGVDLSLEEKIGRLWEAHPELHV